MVARRTRPSNAHHQAAIGFGPVVDEIGFLPVGHEAASLFFYVLAKG